MSVTYGNLDVRLYGPANMLRKIPELCGDLEAFCTDGNFAELCAALPDAGEKTTLSFSNDYDSLDGFDEFSFTQHLKTIAQTCPDIAIACQGSLSSSVTDTRYYQAWYSEAGKKTVKQWNCGTERSIPISFVDRAGKLCELNLLALGNAENLPIGSWGPFEASESDMEYALEEGVPLLITRKACFRSEEWYDASCARRDQAVIKLEREFNQPPNSVANLFAMFDSWNRKPIPNHPEEFLIQAVKLFMGREIPGLHGEARDGHIFLWDDKGVEYIPGCMLEVGGFDIEVNWGFPQKATWI